MLLTVGDLAVNKMMLTGAEAASMIAFTFVLFKVSLL